MPPSKTTSKNSGKTTVVFDPQFLKTMKKHVIDLEITLSQGVQAACRMWAGDYSLQHAQLEKILRFGEVGDRQRVNKLLRELAGDGNGIE